MSEELEYSDNDNRGFLGKFILILVGTLIFLTIIISIINIETGFICKIKVSFNNDSYCYKQYDTRSNLSSSGYIWEIGSHENNRLKALKRIEIQKENTRLEEEAKVCYDSGYFVNETFSLNDYGLTCKRIDYLNNHLMDKFEKKNVGSISGYYSGIISHGSIHGESYQYINNKVVASGKLIENINYQVDCNNKTHNERIDYFTEEEFVMNYVMECIN